MSAPKPAEPRSKLELRGDRVRVTAAEAVATVTGIFARLGCPDDTARAIATGFFAADRQAHFAALQAFDEPELLGDEWTVDAADPPRRRQS